MNLVHLGQSSQYIQTYTPELLQPIERIPQTLPMHGYDLWHAYEISWLNSQGLPKVCLGEFIFPCQSPYLIESKSFKLYLNSFNQTQLTSTDALLQKLNQDLSAACGATVRIQLFDLENPKPLQQLSGIYLDDQTIVCDTYQVNPDFLVTEPGPMVRQSVYSHLLKSNCPVTGQPDWGSIKIDYVGKQINLAGLLRYIVSFRDHQDFHEQCVERIFSDIWQRLQTSELTVCAYYTRRGGLDINPVRSSEAITLESIRLLRQ